MNNNSNRSALKITGVIMIVFAVVYALVGTLAVFGIVEGTLPGHESQEMIIVALAYGVALLAFICGAGCVKGSTGVAKVTGLLFAVLGLVSLIYLQVTQDSFNIVDCLAACYGVSIFSIASKLEKE